MNLKNQPPVLIPQPFRAEIEQLSKAALMDMVWSFAGRCGPSEDRRDIMEIFRGERETVLIARKRA